MISSVKIHHISNEEVNWLYKMAELEPIKGYNCTKTAARAAFAKATRMDLGKTAFTAFGGLI